MLVPHNVVRSAALDCQLSGADWSVSVAKILWPACSGANILLQAHSVRCMGSLDGLGGNSCSSDPNAFCGVTRLVIFLVHFLLSHLLDGSC